MIKTYSWFRKFALAEGISLLILLFIAMPLKYLAGFPEVVTIFGSIHGILFMGFIIIAWYIKSENKKSWGWFGKAFLASILPFGTMVMDKQWKKRKRKYQFEKNNGHKPPRTKKSKFIIMTNFIYSRFLPFIIFCLLSSACSNNNKSKEDEKNDAEKNEIYLWESNLNDSTGKLEMSKDIKADTDSLSVQMLVAYLNTPRIPLQYLKTSNDTIYLKILDANYLTQQMGSTGPVMYFSSVVYNLTELPGIHYINIDFEEGDHASPGVLSRETFKDQ